MEIKPPNKKINFTNKDLAFLLVGFCLIFLNISRGGGFTNAPGNEATGYNIVSFIIWIISIVLIIRGMGKIIQNTKRERQLSVLEIKGNATEKNTGSNINNSRLDNILKLFLAVSFLIIALAVAYYLIIFLPHKENLRTQEQNIKKEALNKCLDDEKRAKEKTVENYLKIKKEGRNFDLSSALEDTDRDYQEKKDDCFKKYPQN